MFNPRFKIIFVESHSSQNIIGKFISIRPASTAARVKRGVIVQTVTTKRRFVSMYLTYSNGCSVIEHATHAGSCVSVSFRILLESVRVKLDGGRTAVTQTPAMTAA